MYKQKSLKHNASPVSKLQTLTRLIDNKMPSKYFKDVCMQHQLTCHNSETQQLYVPYQAAPEMKALMWMLSDAERDLCVSGKIISSILCFDNSKNLVNEVNVKMNKFLQWFLAMGSAFSRSPSTRKLIVTGYYRKQYIRMPLAIHLNINS